MLTPQIISLGGGGFTSELDKFALDRYILAQTCVSEPRVAFLPTASGDSLEYIVNFYSTYTKLPCRPSHLTFFARTPDLRSYLLGQDVIFVGGGNTKSMLAVWREWGVDVLLREAWQNGVVLAGVSAGAICWFEQCITDSFAVRLDVIDGLGFLPGSCCPHYDGEVERRPAYHNLVGSGCSRPGLALDDGAAAHFLGTELHRIVVSRPKARGYHLDIDSSEVTETELPVEVLPDGG